VALWLCLQLPQISAGNVISATLPWSPRLGLEVALRVDGLAAFFGLIITVIGAAIAVYTGYYLENHPRQGVFYAELFLFMTSMLGLVWADSLLMLYAFWEGTSITSYLLIGFNDDDPAAQDGARRAFLVTTLGGLAMLMGMVLLGTEAGSYSISRLLDTPDLMQGVFAPAALLLIMLGAFTKSAQFPFHFWLPGAMAAPTPASAYLHSATMVKAGVYLLARLHPALSDHPIWFWGLLLVGSATLLVAAIVALRQSDIKALLAYATVSQLGLFVALLAFRSEAAYIAVIVYILAHALYKAPLFLVAGIIDHATGTRDLRRLANLRTSLPVTTLIALLAALSMAGVPPMFGFVAKELMLQSSLDAGATMGAIGWIVLLVNVIAAGLTAAAAFILLWEAFFRRHSSEGEAAHVHHPPSPPFVAAPLLLVLIAVAIPFLLPPLERMLFAPAIISVSGSVVEPHLALWHGFNFTLLLSILALLAGVLIFAVRAPVRRVLAISLRHIDATQVWEAAVGRGYQLAYWVTRYVQGITLLRQASGLLTSAVVVMVVVLGAVRWPDDFPINWEVEPHVSEVTMAALAIFSAVITVVAPSRLGAIISMGVVGMAITLYFVFHSAPDLAITQLLVDILTVVLLILVFYRIPPNEYMRRSKGADTPGLILSIFIGVLGFFFVLFTVSRPFFPVIGDYFIYNAVPLGHGGNVVNVILVDFRAFDTYGEVTVLGIAAIGGYAVLRAGLFRFRPPDPLKVDAADIEPHQPSAEQDSAHDALHQPTLSEAKE
jgi:multicomponent Na+:H+ antiporter subunit A